MVKRRSQHERRADTTSEILAVARRLFAARGFANVPTSAIVAETGVTKGALYHHFADKAGLFRAVFEQVEAELVDEVVAVAFAETRESPKATAVAHIVAGVDAFLQALSRPGIAQIVLLDAPAALGWDVYRELDARHGLGVVQLALRRAIDAGAVKDVPIEATSGMLLAALNDAAIQVARAEDPETVKAAVRSALTALLDGLWE